MFITNLVAHLHVDGLDPSLLVLEALCLDHRPWTPHIDIENPIENVARTTS
jgi:hypothetical protein